MCYPQFPVLGTSPAPPE